MLLNHEKPLRGGPANRPHRTRRACRSSRHQIAA
jgi:hypothetical protein